MATVTCMPTFMQASLAYRNSVIYPETGRSIAQTLLGIHLRGALQAVKGFYQLKKEFLMDREERKILAAKLSNKMKTTWDKGGRVLPELAVGDRVRIQNQAALRTIRWDRTGQANSLAS